MTFETVIGQYMQRRWFRNYFSFSEMAKEDNFQRSKEENEYAKEKDPNYKPSDYWRNYRKIANLICGSGEHDCNCDYVCDKIAFYNYFQKIVESEAGKRDYLNENRSTFKKDAELAFFGLDNGSFSRKSDSIMGILKPDIVLVWGQELSKDMLPADHIDKKSFCFKYKEFPNTVFLYMNHPASTDWYVNRENVCKKFSALGTRFKIKSLISSHASSLKTVESLTNTMKKFCSDFHYFYSEVAFTCRLYKLENGIEKEFAEESMYLEASYEDKNCIKIRFFTQDFKKETAWNILKSPEFMIDDHIKSTQFEGRFTLETLPIDSPKSIVVERLCFYMKKMKEWRG